MAQHHEHLYRSSAPRGASNRAFGFVAAAALTVLALLPLVRGRDPRTWALIAAGVVLVAALIAPRALALPNRILSALGHAIQRVVNFVVLAILFLVVFTPVGMVRRLRGADPLRLKERKDSYWIDREGADAAHFNRQF